MDIHRSTQRYEAWLAQTLAQTLDGEPVAADLDRKHAAMATTGAAFPFLRATYWRWAETILTLCPKLAGHTPVLAVGDIHLENFGTWRDADGRLAWGVNDFDEAAIMPWPLDLLRLAASALLAKPDNDGPAVAAAILAGYTNGLATPRPFVLEAEHRWLRDALLVPEDDRKRLWDRLLKPVAEAEGGSIPPPRWRQALVAALPADAATPRFARRVAGLGSLGRPRWIAVAEWRGGPVVREAKAVVPSAWSLARPGPAQGAQPIRCQEIATGRFRLPDPWYAVRGGIAVRRLSPNNRKIDVAGNLDLLLGERMLGAMGHELASVHRGTGDAAAIGAELAAMPPDWLAKAAGRAAAAAAADQAAYAKG